MALTAFLLSAAPASASFPGANGRIVFASQVMGGDFEVYSRNPDGSDLLQLTDNMSFDDRMPAVSADGRKIAFASNRDGDFEIYMMDIDGGNETRVTTRTGSDEGPAWSPDGMRIAFGGNGDGDYEIYTIDPDGSDEDQVTTNTGFDANPDWSPDGMKIAFVRGLTTTAEIWKMDPDGMNEAQLTTNGSQDVDPTWAPDGSKIAFRRETGGPDAEIIAMNPDGTGEDPLPEHGSYDSEPAWGPDGTKIAFASNRDLNFEIYVMSNLGAAQTRLTMTTDGEFDLSWQRLVSAPMATQATPNVTLGQPISDQATLSGGFGMPIGTVTFSAFGPDDPTCAGPAAFTDMETVNGTGMYTTNPSFVPSAPGTYRWIAAYSGDLYNAPVSGLCNDPGETSVVQVTPTISTLATASATLGGQISDQATIAGGSIPTGTITFRSYGPDDATCANLPVYTSSAIAVSGNGVYNSAPAFTPVAAGTYRWRASYSGDANNTAVAGACNDPGETSVVSSLQQQPPSSGGSSPTAATTPAAPACPKAKKKRKKRKRRAVGAKKKKKKKKKRC